MRIARLLTLLLALSATVLSASTKVPGHRGGGTGAHFTRTGAVGASAAPDYWWCNDGHADGDCYGEEDCMNQCLAECGPPCIWYGDAT